MLSLSFVVKVGMLEGLNVGRLEGGSKKAALFTDFGEIGYHLEGRNGGELGTRFLAGGQKGFAGPKGQGE